MKILSKTIQKGLVDIEDLNIPYKIIKEQRKNVRAALGKNEAILRIPYFFSKKEKEDQFDWLKQWLTDLARTKPQVLDRYKFKTYSNNQTLHVGQFSYLLQISKSLKKNKSYGKIKGNTIYLYLAEGDSFNNSKAIEYILSRLVAKDKLDWISKKVDYFNDLYFQKEIDKIKLKYNKSNWGSCSNKKNLNFSTRLLFAPEEVIDYVIIHELAHLIELNHSKKFWALVAHAMPDYKEKEKWLKVNGKDCNF